MAVFSEYITVAFISSLVAGIAEKIAPSSMRRYVNMVAALMLLLYLITPILRMGDSFSDFGDDIIDFDQTIETTQPNFDTVMGYAKEKAEESVKKHLEEQFSLNGNFTVDLVLKKTDETILLTKIIITLSENLSDQAHAIEQYLEEQFHTETTVQKKA